MTFWTKHIFTAVTSKGGNTWQQQIWGDMLSSCFHPKYDVTLTTLTANCICYICDTGYWSSFDTVLIVSSQGFRTAWELLQQPVLWVVTQYQRRRVNVFWHPLVEVEWDLSEVCLQRCILWFTSFSCWSSTSGKGVCRRRIRIVELSLCLFFLMMSLSCVISSFFASVSSNLSQCTQNETNSIIPELFFLPLKRKPSG